jgi:hypothetical protein
MNCPYCEKVTGRLPNVAPGCETNWCCARCGAVRHGSFYSYRKKHRRGYSWYIVPEGCLIVKREQRHK